MPASPGRGPTRPRGPASRTVRQMGETDKVERAATRLASQRARAIESAARCDGVIVRRQVGESLADVDGQELEEGWGADPRPQRLDAGGAVSGAPGGGAVDAGAGGLQPAQDEVSPA